MEEGDVKIPLLKAALVMKMDGDVAPLHKLLPLLNPQHGIWLAPRGDESAQKKYSVGAAKNKMCRKNCRRRRSMLEPVLFLSLPLRQATSIGD